jgi:ribonuclease P protein component
MANAPLSLPHTANDSVISNPVRDSKGRLTGKFPKSSRLLSRVDYKYFYKNSIRLFGEQISVDIRQGKSISAKLGITISRKFGKAHDRNRFKRVVREAFREIHLFLPQHLEMNIIPRKNGISPSKHKVIADLQRLLSKFMS